MGFQADMYTGIGNTSKPSTNSVSGVSENQVDIYNYNKITLHYSTGKTEQATMVTHLVLTQEGCYHNGMPMWTFHDGVYDGDFDISWRSHKHSHHKHVDDRFGSSLCEGASHKLRYGGESGSQGSWEFVTHGYITSWTTASTTNFFNIQGSGDTAGQAGIGMGGWINATGTTDNHPYGRLRVGMKSGGGVMTYDLGGLTALTTDGIFTD